MPRALPLAVRQQIILLHQQHHTAVHISRQLQVNLYSVRKLVQRYKTNPTKGLQPAYSHCGPQKPRSNERMLRAAMWLKRLHPLWGAPLIHLHLKERYQSELLPAVRTLQSWFRKKGLNPPREHRPCRHIGWALAPHNIWQADAKERLVLLNGQPACYLTLCDEHSGACLEALVFPL